MTESSALADFWSGFQSSVPPGSAPPEPYPAGPFGDNPPLADELAERILAGAKTATTSSVWEWEAEGRPLPQPGDRNILLDGAGRPRAVLETTAVIVRPFMDVDAAFAAEEGEDDRSLAAWRRAHEAYFGRVLPKLGHAFCPSMPVVGERFRVIYRADGRLRQTASG